LAVRGFRAVIQGQVQGLGFRPYVYRLAKTLAVHGFVRNSSQGVVIVAQGRNAQALLDRLKRHPPPLAAIASIHITSTRSRPYRDFTIRASQKEVGAGVDVLPDIAICRDCRRETADPTDRRFDYAFTNCTQCGPRYTIINALPYDRPRTTMASFRMCRQCRREYADPANRRYHAQPIACPECGPRLALGKGPKTLTTSPIDAAAQALLAGRTVAIKSLGGFQLACDATNFRAVARLRARKNRPTKPFAVMCESASVASRFCLVSPRARRILLSAAAPIVLLPKSPQPWLKVARSVAPANPRIGVMVCYTPLHVVLFERLRRLSGRPAVLVMTSANRKEDPIVADDSGLAEELPGVPDIVLTHDRPIANRCDDSVVMVGSARQAPGLVVRRARGYAPQPVALAATFHVKHPVLAVGSEFKNAFALASGGKAFMSTHIGTVATARGEEFWLRTFERYVAWTGIQPELIAADLHPDYASTRLAERLSRKLGLPLVRVQHHHAHILSVMAENNLSGRVLGVAFDGAGYGTDGAVWGGEFLLVHGDANWRRVGHLGYLRLGRAGAEVANPAYVARVYAAQARAALGPGGRGPRPARSRAYLTSSVGRLFDAAAAIVAVCRSATFDGQAPVALEAVADPRERGHWFSPDLLDFSVSPALLTPEPILMQVVQETAAGVPPATVAARFHNTIAIAAAQLANTLGRNLGAEAVCLSGGSFQNTLLRDRVAGRLRSLGWQVHLNQAVPPNDGGIALGQAAACSSPFLIP
jgi:hydrogenase maturation protein HypF